MSFRIKIILGVAVIEILLLSLLVFSGMHYLSNSNKEQLYNRAQTSAQLFATMTTDAVVAMDLATLDELVNKTATNPGIVYIRVRNSNGSVLAEKGETAALQKPFHADVDISAARADHTLDVAREISLNGKSYGRVELGWSTKFYENLLNEAAGYMFSVALIEVVLVGIFGFVLGRILTTQLVSLQQGARKVADGELGYTIQVRGKDELADTAMSFNAMSQALDEYAIDLRKARDQANVRRMRAENLLQKAVDSLPHGVVITDNDNHIMHVNRAFANIYSIATDDLEHMDTCDDIRRKLALDGENAYVCIPHSVSESIPMTRLPDGRCVLHSYQALSSGGAVWVDTDITKLVEAEERTRKLERELLQAQKMESIGTLAGGIAHEINTPLQYIGDNLQFLGNSIDEIMNLLTGYEKLAGEVETGNISTSQAQHWRTQVKNADLDFIFTEMPTAAAQSIDGVKQIANIVLAMKEFARPSSKEKRSVDLNRVVKRALTISRNEFKSVADIELHFAEDIPLIQAHESDLNQVVLNLIINAANAIGEKGEEKGKIEVTTQQRPATVAVTIKDDGCGIPEDIIGRIFDPFFTTREVGKGSGQGLAICYDIIVNKYGGKIDVQSVPGEGATFTILLPMADDESEDSERDQNKDCSELGCT